MTDAQVAFPQVGDNKIGWAINIASSTTLWFHWRMHATELTVSSLSSTLFQCNAGLSLVAVEQGSGTDVPFRARATASTTTQGGNWLPGAGVTYTFDVNVRWVSTALTVDFYVNGALNVSRSATDSGAATPSASVLSIGRREYDTSRYFDGMLSDMRIYNRALSADEIAAIAAGRG
jgi:hypothetical protein